MFFLPTVLFIKKAPGRKKGSNMPFKKKRENAIQNFKTTKIAP